MGILLFVGGGGVIDGVGGRGGEEDVGEVFVEDHVVGAAGGGVDGGIGGMVGCAGRRRGMQAVAVGILVYFVLLFSFAVFGVFLTKVLLFFVVDYGCFVVFLVGVDMAQAGTPLIAKLSFRGFVNGCDIILEKFIFWVASFDGWQKRRRRRTGIVANNVVVSRSALQLYVIVHDGLMY